MALSHLKVEQNQIYPDFIAKVRDTRTGFQLLVEADRVILP